MGQLTELFTLTLPLWEIFLRGSVVYLSLVLLFRFVVRRDIGAVGTADLLVLVLIADASQNAMAGEYRTIADGLVLISTLIGWNLALDWASFRFPKIGKLFEADKLLLIDHGKIQRRNLRREFITEEELQAKLRSNGLESVTQVKLAYLESDGEISVIALDRSGAGARAESADSAREKI
jgi:uncharacterized membrane protein YcaP (DUF421 family)